MSTALHPPPAAEPRLLVVGGAGLGREAGAVLAGHDVRVRPDAPDATELRQADLVLLDLAAETPAAIETLARLGRLPEEERPAALSLYDKVAHRTQALALGDALRVPYDPGELRDRLLALVRVQAARRQAATAIRKLEEARAALRATEDRLSRQEADARNPARIGADLAHELYTPLNAVLGFSELLKDQRFGPLGDHRYRGYAADIHHAATHIARVCENALSAAKSDAGTDRLAIEDVSVDDLFRRTLSIVGGLAETGGVGLTTEIEPGFPLLRTDRAKMLQIVLNLVTNAIKFTPTGGSVRLKARVDRARGAMIMVIRDTGVGMTAEEIAVAKKPFGQVGKPFRGPRGTGLGLPLTQTLVERLGGQLEIVSQPGAGTVITIVLPIKASKAA